MSAPTIIWDIGTAYDLFASLQVLHHPARFGLRASWAAGVRSRLLAPHRQVLEEAQELFGTPLAWLYRLPQPKDAAAAQQTLEQLSPANRLPALAMKHDLAHETTAVKVTEKTLQAVYERRAWDEAALEALREAFQQRGRPARPRTLVNILEWWSRPEEFGERYLAALQSYQAVFFNEEERRIRPVLEFSLAEAQNLAEKLEFTKLIETLSQGVQLAVLSEAAQVVLAPSYWTTPLVIYEHVSPDCMLMLFGGRPADETLVPGEMVPDALLRTLKALSDPTRLRILRYLVDQPMTPSQLSRRLRLRNPTMTHHLNALRLAGLVRLLVDEAGERRYTVRAEAVEDTFSGLKRFLEVKGN
jgi:DNA-binding transcriptional ArsR family regulator